MIRPAILLAEDDENDVLLIRQAFKEARIENPLFVVENGDEVIDYFRGVGKFANRAEYPLPSLLLLDLKMPKTNGYEALQWIRANPEFQRLRIIVLTTSPNIREVNRAYQLGANSFLVKPADFQMIVRFVRTLKDYWLEMDQAPDLNRNEDGQAT